MQIFYGFVRKLNLERMRITDESAEHLFSLFIVDSGH